MVQKLITSFSKPLSRYLLRTVTLDDPWQRFPERVPLHVYGAGARKEFRWYFEGDSSVTVRTLDDVLDWLLDCAYVSDPDLFNERDFWQHPRTLEHLRKGDCEDFSIWAWRKLVELDYDAEFVAGRCSEPQCSLKGHTWVLFQQDETPFLFDPVLRKRRTMIRPLDEVRQEYTPEVSVDHQFKRYAYAGYYRRLRAGRSAAL